MTLIIHDAIRAQQLERITTFDDYAADAESDVWLGDDSVYTRSICL